MADDHFVPGDPQTCERSARDFQERVQKMSFDEMLAKIKELGINGTAAMYAIPECKKAAIELGRLTTEQQVIRKALNSISMIKLDESGHVTTLEQAVHMARNALSDLDRIANGDLVSGTPGHD